MKRNGIFWGALLILLGGLMLLNAMGVTLPGGIYPRELFWPLFLVMLGLWFVLEVFTFKRPEDETLAVELRGVKQAEIKLNHGAGSLTIAGGADAGMLLNGSFLGGVDESIHYEGEKAEVRLRAQPRGPIFVGQASPNDWSLRLTDAIPLELSLNTGASESTIDLSAVRVSELKLSTGASSTRLTLPAAGQTSARISAGAASLDLTIPAGTAARLRIRSGVGSIEVDRARFPKVDGAYQSPDYESAANRVDVNISAGVGSVTVK